MLAQINGNSRLLGQRCRGQSRLSSVYSSIGYVIVGETYNTNTSSLDVWVAASLSIIEKRASPSGCVVMRSLNILDGECSEHTRTRVSSPKENLSPTSFYSTGGARKGPPRLIFYSPKSHTPNEESRCMPDPLLKPIWNDGPVHVNVLLSSHPPENC